MIASYFGNIELTRFEKIQLALAGQTRLTNRSLLSTREGESKRCQCKSILDWMSEHAELA